MILLLLAQWWRRGALPPPPAPPTVTLPVRGLVFVHAQAAPAILWQSRVAPAVRTDTHTTPAIVWASTLRGVHD